MTWAYLDDIICRAKSLFDLLKKLQIFFDIFLKYNIIIKSTKSFLNYSDIEFLDQQVNFLGLTTSEKNLRVIKQLIYPENLSILEYYLILTGYLYNYIHLYAQLAAPLQALKTSLLCNASVSSQQQQVYASKTRLEPLISQQHLSFWSIQKALSHFSILIYLTLNKILWIDLDASENFGFEVVVFHTSIKKKLFQGHWPTSSSLQPIFFFFGFSAPSWRITGQQSYRFQALFG